MLLLLPMSPAFAKDLRILVSGIESDQGQIMCLLFSDEDAFPADVAGAATRMSYPAVEGLLTCTFPDVPAGRYAVSVVHDEDGNGEVDTNFRGAIKEPWGITNNVRPPRRGPKFHEAVIYVGETQPADYEVKLQR